ncbi:MAG: glycosyltransferase [Betaproteobacteria bacterium]
MDARSPVVAASARDMIVLDQHFVVDVVVPVYNAPDDVRQCVASVLMHLRPDVRLILIDDASTNAEVSTFFDEMARRAHPQVVLLRNDVNLGFTGTANRGMGLSRADVILLNSDTIVTEGWLDAIMHGAATDARIGTITPFSNNAEICSFPDFCVANAWPEGADPNTVAAAMAAAAVPTYPDLPTGVGFCMFVRRALLDAIGDFDPVFGLGYGEENDFCLRAAAAGWRNVLADNAFVVHTGGRSFEGQKAWLGPRNMALLLERHPHYLDMVQAYIAADPLRPLREAAALRLAVATSPDRGVLHVIHHHGGGTETHVRALIEASRDRWRHYLAIAVGDYWQVEEHRPDGRIVTFEFLRTSSEPWRDFLGGICASFGIALLHLHNISACRDGILMALDDPPVPFGYTVHDLNFACPTITFLGPDGRFCGTQTDPLVCASCLAAQPIFADIDIVQWRAQHHALLARAAFRIAPSQWVAATLLRYFPDCPATVIAHGAVPAAVKVLDAPPSLSVPDDGIPTVALLGAIGPDKGARRIERLVDLARARKAPVRFVLIGYMDVEHGPMQTRDARFTVHGRYAAADLPALLQHYRVSVVLFPSAGPETFSYTLTEAWTAGLSAIVPPIGALAERMQGSGAGVVLTDDEWHDDVQMFERLMILLGDAQRGALRSMGARALAHPHASIDAMTERTFALYAAARSRAGAASSSFMAFEPGRIRASLRYLAWQPPATARQIVPNASTGWLNRIAHAALDRRHTLAGRILARCTPATVRAALRARLKP